MKVIIAATHSCPHCPLIARELRRMDVEVEVRYFEDHPELTTDYGLKKSPSILVDGKVAFVGMPSLAELKDYLEERKRSTHGKG